VQKAKKFKIRRVAAYKTLYIDRFKNAWYYQEKNRKGKTALFDAAKTTAEAVNWIRDFFEKNGKGCNAIVGISGGKDSSVVAALCVRALGRERVIGVLMPNGEQSDIDMARLLVNTLEIKNIEVNIAKAYNGAVEAIGESLCNNGMEPFELSKQATVNLPARLRMTMLYAIGQSHNGRVANTCNLSEDYVGYATRYGDGAGDFSPLARLTVQEVKAIGSYLGLPDVLVNKAPSDGLSGLTDEDNLGFTYAALDKYIREGVCENEETKKRIDRLHELNKFKIELMPCYEYEA